MKILAIETSVGRALSLAVSDNKKIISEQRIEVVEDLSFEIVPALKRLLEKAGLSLDSMDGFAVDVGPGSFTGLRIGLSAAKALSFALHKPLVGISSLDILAESLSCDECQICSIIDAKRSNVYACFYEKKHNQIKRKAAYLLLGVDSLLGMVRRKTIFVGDALFLYREKISQRKKGLAFFAEEKLWQPEIKSLLKLSYGSFARRSLVDPRKIAPIYLYPQECQVRKN